jgi:hypothetical protein
LRADGGQPGEERLVKGGSGSAAVRTDAIIVGTMEVLRARLLDKPEPEPEPPAPPPRRDQPEKPTAEAGEEGPLTLGAVIGLDHGGTGFQFSSSFQLNADVAIYDTLRLRALLRVPMASARAEQGSASAEVKALVAAGAFAVGGELLPSWWLDFMLGGGAAHVTAEGFSEVPASTRSVDRWVFVVASGAHTAWQLNSALALTVHAAAAVAPVPVEVYVNEERIATWGRPAVLTGVGLEFRPTFF